MMHIVKLNHCPEFNASDREQALTIDEILFSLTHFSPIYPLNAMREAVKQREEITPHFLDYLKKTRGNYKSLNNDWWIIPASYLLAEFKVTEAFPLIIDLISLPKNVVEMLYGDLITEDMQNILASTYNGDFKLLAKFIEDDAIWEYSRLAGLEAIVVLYNEKVLSREKVIEYFSYLFHSGLKKETSSTWAILVSACMLLEVKELFEQCQTAFDEELVDRGWFHRSDIEDAIIHGNHGFKDPFRRHYFVTNVVERFARWACFNKEAPHEVVIKAKVKIGRNDPCPCGSAKKYKKCCLK